MNQNTIYKYVDTCQNSLALCSTSQKDKFWLDDPTELYKDYLTFIPKYEMTENQQLNAISRFCFYMILIILVFGRGQSLLFVPITILIIVILMNKIYMGDKFGKMKELGKILGIREERNIDEMSKEKEEYSSDIAKEYPTYQDRIDKENAAKDYTLEAGYYDSNGELRLGSMEYPTTQHEQALPYTIDEMDDYRRNTCRRPTPDNPLMNTPITDFGQPNQPSACNEDDDKINDEIKVNFNHELFRDVDEVWDKVNSQRQFYTMPNTAIPNNQSEFANWLYKRPEGTMCKNEDMSKCIKFYDDLRYRNR
jgi:hypothetical protein